jgi:hypothetical protein
LGVLMVDPSTVAAQLVPVRTGLAKEHAVNPADDADRLQQQMAEIRGELYDDVHGIVESARTMSDWRYYVRSYPWACVSAALALGYLAVPQRLQIVSPDVKTLLRLAKKNRLVVDPKPEPSARGGLAAVVLSLVAKTAMQAALSYVGKRTGIKEQAHERSHT